METEPRTRLPRETWIFQDKDDIRQGERWRERIDESLKRARVLIPIVTPSLFLRSECVKELLAFKDREKATGIRPQVLPILFIHTDGIGHSHRTPGSGVSGPETRDLVTWLNSYQHVDWIKLRNQDPTSTNYREAISDLAERLVEMSSQPDQPPEPPPQPPVEPGSGTTETEEEGSQAGQSTDPLLESGQKTGSKQVQKSVKTKRWIGPVIATAGLIVIAVVGLLMFDSCRSTGEPQAICRLFSPSLARIEGKYYISADEPVTAYKTPDTEADIIRDLPTGFKLNALWEVEGTEWYAFETAPGEKAYILGKVFRSIEDPELVRLEGEYFLSADRVRHCIRDPGHGGGCRPRSSHRVHV